MAATPVEGIRDPFREFDPFSCRSETGPLPETRRGCGRAEVLQLRFSGRKTPVTRHRFTRNSAVASLTTSDSDVPICAKSVTSNVLTGKVFGIPLSGKMARGGKRLKAVRLASGDMISLSRRVRQILDEAGFERVKIFASGSFDEYKIDRFVKEGASGDAFGVGTRMPASSITGPARQNYINPPMADSPADQYLDVGD